MTPTTPFLATLLAFTDALAERHRRLREDSDRGLSTLEWSVLGLGIFLAAVAIIAVFNLAIDARTSQIQ